MNKKFNSALSVILATLIIFSSAVCGVAINSNTDATEEITTTVESTTVADTSEEATSVEATTDKTTASEEETTIETTAEPSVEETTTELTTEATTEATTEPTLPDPEHVVSTATIAATGDILMHMPIFDDYKYNAAVQQADGTYDFTSVFQLWRNIVIDTIGRNGNCAVNITRGEYRKIAYFQMKGK